MPEPQITTARSARLGLPYLFPGQAQKEAFVNEALARLDALVQPAVLDERDDPPADPAPGDCHIVGAAPIGDWAGHAGAIALWAQSQWLFTAARTGMLVYDQASGRFARYAEGDGWTRAQGAAEPAGGAVIDTEMRAAFAALLTNLRSTGFFA
jgi:hypothetical protein